MPLAGEPNRADPPPPVVRPHSAQANPAVTLDRFLMLCHTSLTRFPPGFRPGVPRLASSGDPPPRERAPVTFSRRRLLCLPPLCSWPFDPRRTIKIRSEAGVPQRLDLDPAANIVRYRFAGVSNLSRPSSIRRIGLDPDRGGISAVHFKSGGSREL
jgi:hypothetical protein